MENHTQDEELKAHLLQTNEEFRTLAGQHAQLKQQIEEIESKPHVTPADELEEQRLKKLKLRVKDQMNEILAQNKHASVQ
ncbi:MAG: YdcH family protein [Acidobacteriaceae bacterium]|nr:YdcH family protein [Acidobacteriaceae bacterium]MBV9780440.1 YdcH family protein [Acidobacteriaceae bacterium]